MLTYKQVQMTLHNMHAFPISSAGLAGSPQHIAINDYVMLTWYF
jgi:hypothetical protein